MPAPAQGTPSGAAPGGLQEERELVAANVRTSLPPTFMFVGAVYVFFSGTVFLYLTGTAATPDTSSASEKAPVSWARDQPSSASIGGNMFSL